MSPLSRWTDDRLDDLAREIRQHAERLTALERIPVVLAEMGASIKAGNEDSHECRAEIRELKAALARHEAARAAEREAQRKERKADRYVWISTALASAGIVITALALFMH